MTSQPSRSERETRILDLYLAARALPEEERRAYVEQETSDPEIRREVLRLVEAKTVTFLNGSLPDFTEILPPGRVVADRYQVIKRLGNGGMGVVYEVLDRVIHKRRALKVICAEAEGSDDIRSRFYREVSTAQLVAHPNVCRIFDIGFDPAQGIPVEKECDRLLFLTMELLDGETLAQRIARGPIDADTSLDIIRQVTSALTAAHAREVIHRDIKPANIMLVPHADGKVRAVVMDFGLARCLNDEEEAQLTRVGDVVGTPIYMAPEQAVGLYTPATDVYALGIVLYEMLTGQRPFVPGKSLVERKPVPPSQHVPDLDACWEAVILKCLSNDPTQRYRNPAEVIAALEPPRRWWPPTRRELLVAGSAVLALAVIGLLSFFALSSGVATPKERFVAVLPFSVVGDSANADLLAIGLTDSLSARLFQWRNLRMPAASAVEGVARNLPIKRIARELGANILVHGTIQADSGQVRVNLKIEDAAAGQVLKQQELLGSRARFLDLQDRIYSTVVSTLNLHPGPDQPSKTVQVASTNPDAADLFWKARQKMSKQRNIQDVQESIRFYEQSVRIDPTFARARAYLSYAYVVLYRLSHEKIHADRAVEAAEEACRLDDSLADAHLALGYAYNEIGQSPAAISEARRALELAPNSADGYRRLGRIYQDAGDKDSTLKAYAKAVELNPHYWNTHLQLAAAYFRYGENQKALQHYQLVTEQVPERAEGFQGLGTVHLQMGDFARSEAAYEKALSVQKRPANYSGLGTAYYFQRRYDDAIRMFKKAIELAPKQELYYGNLADCYRLSGKLEEARQAYKQAMALAHSDLATNPRSAASLGSLALYYVRTGEIKQGLDYIQKARDVDPENVALQYNEAVVRTAAGQTTEAAKALGQAIKGGYSSRLADADPDISQQRARRSE